MKNKLTIARSIIRKRLLFSIMKTFIFLLCTTVFGLNTENSFSQEKILIQQDQLVTVDQVFKLIKQQTTYRFIYPKKLFKNAVKVHLEKGEILVTTLLKQSLLKEDLNFELFENNTIVIKENQLLVNSKPKENAKSQTIEVSGVISDSNGFPLPGASILEKGTTNGVQSDFDGNFSIKVSKENAILIVSYIGYLTQEISVSNRTFITIKLIENASKLDEVVVVGYGSQRKTELTGAVASVNSEELTKNAGATIDNALQGKVAGVSISTNNATPGGGVSVRIRGAGGINNSEPLYVVDGIIFAANGNENSSPLSFINPQDINSISILKDAASAAIYGARAANGVVLITTKRGKGKSTVTINTSYGVQSIIKTNEMMDASTYATFVNTANQNAGLAAPFANPASFGKGTNWIDAITRSAAISDKNVSFSGGDETGNYFLSVGHFSQEGIVIGTDFQRISVRTNADKKITDKFSVGTSIGLTRTIQNSFSNARGSNGNPIYEGGQFYPTIPKYDENGDYAPTPANGFYKSYVNPLFLVNAPQTPPIVKSLQSNLYLEYKILKNLTFKTSASYVFGNTVDQEIGRIYNLGTASEKRQYVSKFQSSNSTILVENLLNYRYTNDTHNFNILLGQSAQEYRGEFISANGYYNDGGHNAINESADNLSLVSDIQESSLNSYFSRVNYGYKGKYLMTANIRYDGSSKFGANNKWGLFPSVSGAWNISEENFFPKEALVNSLKLRSGWGQVGSEEGLGNYDTSAAIVSIYGYGFGNTSGTLATGSAANSIANPDLKWETVTQFSIGFDASLLDNKLSLTAEYYKKKNTDMLLKVPQSSVTGLSNGQNQGVIAQNIAELNNSGFELSADYSSKIGKLTYDLGANITTINNEVTKLGPGGKLFGFNFLGDNQTLTQVGGELGQFYGFLADGLFQSQAEVDAHAFQNVKTAPGDIRFKDLDGNDIIDNNDKTITGSPIPDFVYGFNFNLGYNNFDLSIQASGSHGNDILNLTKRDLIDNTTNENKLNFSPWSPTNTGSVYPRANVQDLSDNSNIRPSSYFVEDGSYLKVKVIQLGYTLNSELLNKIKMSNLRVYTSLQNPFIITKYSGVDPEVGNAGGSNLAAGIDHFVYPAQRTISIGLNASF